MDVSSHVVAAALLAYISSLLDVGAGLVVETALAAGRRQNGIMVLE